MQHVAIASRTRGAGSAITLARSPDRRGLLQNEPALFLELGAIDLALGETLLQDRHGARRGLARLGLFAAARPRPAAAHQHGQILPWLTEIIGRSRRLPRRTPARGLGSPWA